MSPYADKEQGKNHAKQYRGTIEYQEKQRKRMVEWQKANPERAKKIKKDFVNRKIEWLLSFIGTDKLHCDRCRYDKSFVALQFHHINPSDKETVKDHMANWMRHYSLVNFQEKVIKTRFLILCANCHAEFHAGLWSWDK
jgi:hypothetical protein